MYFRRQGYIRFENYPLHFQLIKDLADKHTQPRDLWRKEPFLKKLIVHTFGPMALELTKKGALRVACDQWLKEPPVVVTRMQDLFCFQGLACIFVLSPNDQESFLEVFEPSSLTSRLPPEAYLVAFALENGVLIENPKDPFNTQTRNLGYVYGDRLNNTINPLIVLK